MIAVWLIALPAAAQTVAPTELGHFNGWTAYTLPDGKRTTCYAVTGPSKTDPNVKQSKPNLMVTHSPSEHTYNVVSIDLGAELAPGTAADVAIGKTTFDFFTKDKSAWSRDADTDKTVVVAMTQGQDLAVKTRPPKGRSLTVSFSLAGFPQAVAAIDKACKYKR